MPDAGNRVVSAVRGLSLSTVSPSVRSGPHWPDQTPKRTQFRKGTSGNPKGRPKGSKNLTTLIMEAARDKVTVDIDGKPRRISALQATVTQLANKASRGDQKAMVQFLDRIAEVEGRVRPSEYPLGDPDVEVLRAAFERMQQCEPERRGE